MSVPENSCQTIKADIIFLKNECQKYRKENELLNGDITFLKNAYLEYRKEIELLNVHIENFDSQIEKLQRRQNDVAANAQNELNEQISILNGQNERLQAQNQKLLRSYGKQQIILSKVLEILQNCKYDSPIDKEVRDQYGQDSLSGK